MSIENSADNIKMREIKLITESTKKLKNQLETFREDRKLRLTVSTLNIHSLSTIKDVTSIRPRQWRAPQGVRIETELILGIVSTDGLVHDVEGKKLRLK